MDKHPETAILKRFPAAEILRRGLVTGLRGQPAGPQS